MTNATIKDARGVHAGLALGLLAMYPVLFLLIGQILIQSPDEDWVSWIVGVGVLYAPQPVALVLWLCGVRAILGLSQPLISLRQPFVLLQFAGGLGVMLILGTFSLLCYFLLNPEWSLAATAAIAVGAFFVVWSLWSFVRTLQWARVQLAAAAGS